MASSGRARRRASGHAADVPRPFRDAGWASPVRPVEHRPAAEDLDATFPVYLTTGRLLQHYQSGAQTRRVRVLNEAQPEPMVEVHPDLAEIHELVEGDRVRVISRRGAAEGLARITETIRADTVFMPFHWGGTQSANNVTNPVLDPISGMPEFKVCAVRLEAVA